MHVINAQGKQEEFERALVDRFGFAIRAGGQDSPQRGGQISLEPSGVPAVNDFEIATVSVVMSHQDPAQASTDEGLDNQLTSQLPSDADLGNGITPDNSVFRAALLARARSVLSRFGILSDAQQPPLEAVSATRTYSASPLLRIVNFQATRDEE